MSNGAAPGVKLRGLLVQQHDGRRKHASYVRAYNLFAQTRLHDVTRTNCRDSSYEIFTRVAFCNLKVTARADQRHAVPGSRNGSTFRFRHLEDIFRVRTDVEAAGGDGHPNSECRPCHSHTNPDPHPGDRAWTPETRRSAIFSGRCCASEKSLDCSKVSPATATILIAAIAR